MEKSSLPSSRSATVETLVAENEELRRRVEEAEETLEAIRTGGVDAVVVEESTGHRVYTLEGAERPYRLFVEEMQQGAATLQPDGTIVWCNSQLCELLKAPQEKLIGSLLQEFVAPDHRVAYDNLLWQGQSRMGRGEAQFVRTGGAAVPVFLTFNALPADCGAAIGVLVTDLTSQRHHEQLTEAHAALRESELALRQAQAELGTHAGQLERLVSDRTAELRASHEHLEAFVYSIAHDLRAPLRSMEGFSALLLEEVGSQLSPASQEYAWRINRSAQAMDALLRDLLDFSRLTQQQICLVPVNLGVVLRNVVSRLETQIQEANASLELPGPFPFVLGHEATLSQVLLNLLTNALKFRNPNAPAVVRAWAEEYGDVASPHWAPGEARGTRVRMCVEDRGIGIAPEHQQQIFKLFTRLNGEKYPGTGVGLAIVQKGVQRMGGTVGIKSTEGEGVRIWFDLRKASGEPQT